MAMIREVTRWAYKGTLYPNLDAATSAAHDNLCEVLIDDVLKDIVFGPKMKLAIRAALESPSNRRKVLHAMDY